VTGPRLDVPILMLHHVEPAPDRLEPRPRFRNSYLSRQEFADFLDLLVGRRSTTLTLAEAVRRIAAGDALPPRTVLLTFDDACRCFHRHALPELEKRQLRATVFAVSGELGGSNRWDHENRVAGDRERREDLMDAAELRDTAARGVEVGAHSRTHRDLTTCTRAELDVEVAGCREELSSALGSPVETFCYPYGQWDDDARSAVSQAGYRAAAALDLHRGQDPGDLLALRRFAINPHESRFERNLKLSGRYAPWSRLPRLGLLRGLRGRNTP
jgi:peptidoglycan/xylan/chitin deacetylase (PgdA/CDA1 family)